MKNVMDYETIDWDAEALRIARAFGVEAPLRFRRKIKDSKIRHDLLSGSHTHIVVHETLRLTVNYKPHCLHFKLHYGDVATAVTIGYNGMVGQATVESKYSNQLAKGLFHLGLLHHDTIEILGWSISEHDKLEWLLEYEERYDV